MSSLPVWASVLIPIVLLGAWIWSFGGIKEYIERAKNNIKQMGVIGFILWILALAALTIIVSRFA